MAGARHGMCELTRHGMAGNGKGKARARHGMCELAFMDPAQSVGLLWTSDQPDAETSTCQHTTNTTDIHAPGGVRTYYLSKRAAADRRHRPRGHWERLF
jgi:hypothetical protein